MKGGVIMVIGLRRGRGVMLIEDSGSDTAAGEIARSSSSVLTPTLILTAVGGDSNPR